MYGQNINTQLSVKFNNSSHFGVEIQFSINCNSANYDEASRIPGESTLGGLKSLSVIFLLLLNFNNFSLSELQSSAINVCSFQTTCHPGTLRKGQWSCSEDNCPCSENCWNKSLLKARRKVKWKTNCVNFQIYVK